MRGPIRLILQPAAASTAGNLANLFMRLAFGSMVLVIHGWHKAAQYIEHLNSGADWQLAKEIQEMGAPAPLASAMLAMFVQIIAPLCLIAGFITRPAAASLAIVLGGAIAQNLHAHRDPQLALLYSISATTLALWGSTRYSLDAAFFQPQLKA